RRSHLQADGVGAGRLAEQCDVSRISTEGSDVLLYPMKCGGLIEEAVVSRGMLRGLIRKCLGREEAEYPDAIVDSDDKDALVSESLAVIARVGRTTLTETAPVDPDHHWEFGWS